MTASCRYQLGHVETVGQERLHPLQLGAQLRIAVITGAVHPDRVSLTVAGGDTKDCVLAIFEQRELACLEAPRFERHAGERRDPLALLRRCQLVEARHCDVTPRAERRREWQAEGLRSPSRTASAVGS